MLAEVRLRGGLDPVGAVPEVDGVEVGLEDLVLAELLLELHREQRLADLLRDRTLREDIGLHAVGIGRVGTGVDVLHELLGERRGALHRAALHDVGVGGTQDAADVDPGVVVEVVVLGGDHGVDHVRRDLRQGHQRAIDRPVQRREQMPVAVIQIGGLDRRQGLGQRDARVGDVQADAGERHHHERRQQQQEPPLPTQEGLLLRAGGRLRGARRRRAGRCGCPPGSRRALRSVSGSVGLPIGGWRRTACHGDSDASNALTRTGGSGCGIRVTAARFAASRRHCAEP